MIKKINYNTAKKTNLYNLLRDNNYLIVENCFSENEMIKSRNELMNFFSQKNFEYKKSKNKNLFHRWDFEPKKAKFKRIMNSTTFSLNDKKYFKNCLKLIRKGLILKKNFIKNLKDKKGFSKEVFCRGSLYPSGGGYYQSHDDTFSREAVLDVIPLSIKNRDFFKGGFEVKIKKKSILIENYLKPGSIILLKPSIKHGVKKIDPKMKFNRKSLSGRLSLLSVLNLK